MIGGRYVSAQQHPKEKRQITSLLELKALSLPKGFVENRRAAGGRVLQRHVPKALSLRVP